MIKLRPVGARLVVQRREAAAMSEGQHGKAVVIPDSAKEKLHEGTVVAVGPGVENPTRTLQGQPKQEIAVGAHVVFTSFAGNDIHISGNPFLVIHADDVLAVVEGE